MVSAQGITPKRDPIDLALRPTLLGEEKGILAKRAAVVLSCRLLSLVDCCAGRAGQRCNVERELFHTAISGIVMSNQNAARPQGTLQPPHYSVRLDFIFHSTALTCYRNFESKLLIMAFSFQQ